MSPFGVGELPSCSSLSGDWSTSMGAGEAGQLASVLALEGVRFVRLRRVAKMGSGRGFHVVLLARRLSCLRVSILWAFSALRSILKAEISCLAVALASARRHSLSSRISYMSASWPSCALQRVSS